MPKSPKDEIKIYKIVQKEATVFELFLEKNKDGQPVQERMYVRDASLAQLGLLKPGTITMAQYKRLGSENTFQIAYNQAVHYLGYRKRSVAQVQLFLNEKALFSAETIQRVIDKLLEQRYLDDVDFVRSYIATMLKTSAAGPGKVRQKLIDFGCADTLVQAQLLTLFTHELEVDRLVQLRQKMLKKKYVSRRAFNEKYSQKATDLGYSYERIQANKLTDERDQAFQLDINKINKIIAKTYDRLRKKGERDYVIKQRLAQKLIVKGVRFEQAAQYVAHFYEQLGEKDET